MLIIEPPPTFRISGMACLVPRNVRHLLGHSSGLPEPADFVEVNLQEQVRYLAFWQVGSPTELERDFQPGWEPQLCSWLYSDYLLLQGSRSG